MRRPVTLIFNPVSGGGRGSKVSAAAAAWFAERGIECETVASRSLDHAREMAVAAGESGRLVAACGGDGLIAAVAAGCAETGAVLSVIPGGRGNDLARALGVPADTSEACALVVSGVPTRIDLGEGNGREFCCIASVGFDSDANRLANEASGNGSLVYLSAALKALRAWKPARFTLRLDGAEREFSGYSVVVANSKAYGGGMLVAPDADPTDGLFDVVMISEGSKVTFLLRLPLVFLGRHVRSSNVTVERASRVEISADRDFEVYADGDPLCPLPATITMRPRALDVLLPS